MTKSYVYAMDARPGTRVYANARGGARWFKLERVEPAAEGSQVKLTLDGRPVHAYPQQMVLVKE